MNIPESLHVLSGDGGGYTVQASGRLSKQIYGTSDFTHFTYYHLCSGQQRCGKILICAVVISVVKGLSNRNGGVI